MSHGENKPLPNNKKLGRKKIVRNCDTTGESPYHFAYGTPNETTKIRSFTVACVIIFMKEGSKSTRDAQRRLNPLMMEVVKNEILKLLSVGIIYPIYDNIPSVTKEVENHNCEE